MSIDERPAVVDRCNRVGDWEGDTVIGKGRKGALLDGAQDLVHSDRATDRQKMADAAVAHMAHLTDKVKTITFDNLSSPGMKR